MIEKGWRSVPVRSVVETLEGRTLLSAAGTVSSPARAADRSAVVFDAKAVKRAATKTAMSVSAGMLGQPITFTVTVRAAAKAGSPTGTVNIIDHRSVVQSVALTPMTSTNAKFVYSQATYTLTPQPGGAAYFIGRHGVSTTFVPTGTFRKSSGKKTFSVSKPVYTPLAGGVKVDTIVNGSGVGIASGQTANVLYTGYLAKSGHIFDDSINHGGTPFTFALGTGAVIPGFDEGTVGMEVGETRLVYIPPKEGYGAKRNGSIPGSSTLIFVLTLESIS